jgi:hypothetical protein
LPGYRFNDAVFGKRQQGYADNALSMDELTAILGNGRFKTLLKHLRTHFPSLHARPASAVDKDTHNEVL